VSLAAAVASASGAPARYSIVDLGTLGGQLTIAFGLNDRGQASGFAATASGDQHAFIWQNGDLVDLGTLGGNFSRADLINNRGQTGGDATTASGEHHLAMWQLRNGHILTTDLGMVPGATDMFGLAINDFSRVLGEADFPDGVAHTVLADQRGVRDLHGQVTLGGPADSAFGINDSGQIAGVADTAGLDSHAFLLDRAGLHDLGALDGTWSEALAINAAGQIAGSSGTDPTQHCAYQNFQIGLCMVQPGLSVHAFLYSGGVMHDLRPAPGFPESRGEWVDSRGNVVGASFTLAQDTFVATRWVKGNPTDLNTLLVNAPPDLLVLMEILWGNERGQLVGYGPTISGDIHSYLLTPVGDEAW